MTNEKIDFYSSTNLKSYNLDAIMKYQLSMLDRMDVFTRRHSENVANLVCRICEYLHCKKVFTIHATICGYLHDIGKLFIPPEVLNKPGSLTKEEYDIMKKHTTFGYEMCMKDLKLRPYADGALYHHEALNGSGYPQGLRKKDIPYVAQIIRVADEYDAIVTKRQYVTHINISETLKELIRDAVPAEYIKTVALDALNENCRVGKINSKVLKSLFKVVIDDTLYEISCVMEYIDFLYEQIDRLEKIEKYDLKSQKAKKDKDKNYYREGMKMLFKHGETFENYQTVLDEYREAIILRQDVKEKLYKEIKIIKKLRI
ncbi:MAG: HD domain-containing protein [Clostridiaceae bacterium]|nr:HD domain-containing protein [Clostridiaceae bacterium]